MSKYPRDEFDRVPESAGRQGVHRAAESTPPRAALAPVLIAGAAALLIGLLAYFVVPQITGKQVAASPSSSSPASTASTTTAPAATSPASTGPATTGPATTAPATTAPATESATPSQTPTPSEAGEDKTVPVSVYNATTTAGLGASVGSNLQNNGWTLGAVANWQGAQQSTSVIFYNGAVQKANAEALGKLLNITVLVDTPDLGEPISVVLGPGFQ
ncbi:LytR C-terminal domain-containing protein [Pseudarthrobacter sp. J1738]|uniref:LytR C-terminal domain-containing protein n=1 Tax=unclassified Pseudarthrobacter TaxID=2647000 RepID=UPI003D2C2D94